MSRNQYEEASRAPAGPPGHHPHPSVCERLRNSRPAPGRRGGTAAAQADSIRCSSFIPAPTHHFFQSPGPAAGGRGGRGLSGPPRGGGACDVVRATPGPGSPPCSCPPPAPAARGGSGSREASSRPHRLAAPMLPTRK